MNYNFALGLFFLLFITSCCLLSKLHRERKHRNAMVQDAIASCEETETRDVSIKELEEKTVNTESDPLTGLYNWSTANKLIDEYLICHKQELGSALFMIDVDNFKQINDHLGHLFGDAVLCELADKLNTIFDTNAIVGRMGGDEFAVFLKEGATHQLVKKKATEIGKAFQVSYQGADKKAHAISSSIGVSFAPYDGDSFKELYSYADVALYAAKKEGKNRCKFYDGSKAMPDSSRRTEIQIGGEVLQKGFRENRIEYVFKMLYQSEAPVLAIHSVLELIARHFSFERGYIFEISKDEKTISDTFEWCEDEVQAEIENLQNIPIEAIATAHANLQQFGTFVLTNLNHLCSRERAILEPQGIKSMFLVGIFDKSKLLGFIGFDNCRSEALSNETEIDEMKTICNILATFFVRQYMDEISKKDLLVRQEVLNHLENYIYVINTETFELLFRNEKIQTLLNDEGKKSVCYSFFRGQSEQCEDCPIKKLSRKGKDRTVSEIFNQKMGMWMETSAILMRWTDGSPACLINCTDITEQKEEQLNYVKQLERLLYVDTLTGASTYPKFQIDAKRILDLLPNERRILVKIDIANFKLINQIYGFEKGNQILSYVAEAFRQTIRSQKELFARINNDEFVAFFSIEDKAEMEQIIHKFHINFECLVDGSFSFQCKFPYGCYVIEPGDIKKMTIHDMFEKANIAHKAAKSNKSISFAFYNDEMTKEALRIKTIENRMMEALAREEFTVYLQPKYYLQDETIGGAEALSRWGNEENDFFSPGTFIPIFEQNGFITKLDFYIFEKTCRIIKSWIAEGIEPVPVSVNFSRLHLEHADFVKRLCEVVDKVGIERNYLEIEITESVIFDNIDTLEILLREIHQNGFSMSMDDFGSGYSSLGMLKDFPVDGIKMDRSFFANQRDEKRSKIVVGSIIQMATDLGVCIVAEGVEEQAHINFLRELNCDMVQGYYYAKPMPVDSFAEILRR